MTRETLRQAVFALVAFSVTAGAADPPLNVIIDHDGAVDDLIAVSLLIKSPAVRVHAITICPGDSYLEPATRATQLFLDRLGAEKITIAQGHSEGTNPFPAEWRADAGHVLGIRALKGATGTGVNPVVKEDAAHHLVRLLRSGPSWTILETGPLTNIADALRIDPSVRRHIARIFAMGGALRVPGNVQKPGHDGSAEWNVFNQPQAAADVIRSGIPVTLVPLDATNKAPLTQGFLDRLARQRSMAAQLAAQSWQLVVPQGDQYFWDTLTAAALLDPGIVRTERLRIRVITSSASEGRVVEDREGVPVDVALDASRDRLEKLFLDVLGR